MISFIEIVEILVFGIIVLVGLGVIIGIIRSKEYDFGETIVVIVVVGCLFFIPGQESYLCLEKSFRKPTQSNKKETYVSGKLYIWYQDTAHLCNASDKNSTIFTSLIAPDDQVSRRDTCIICGKTFECHNTLKDQRRIELAIEQSEVLSLIPE